MAEYDTRTTRSVGTIANPAIDAGLRSYMLRVYNYMLAGLVLTGVSAFVALQPSVFQLFFSPTGATALGWIALLAPLGIVFFLGFRIQAISVGTAQATFWVFSALMGIGLAPTFLVYTGSSIARVFFITAATFGAMSLYGYTTKRDLSGWGSFLFMGLIGILIAMVVNIFLQSTMMDFVISSLGVLIFTGLTAYDTQKIKESYSSSYGADTLSKGAIMGALKLYLDFINLFIMLLRLIGERR